MNLASRVDFQFVEGLNTDLAERIVKYRSKLEGFSFEGQLYEVFDISAPVVEKILKTFKIVQKLRIRK
ncbi:helix-hairpin-helix domain-containing protein [Polaribacter sp.]|nr:helix-hairpin-helix domain-containing protein [Polaribacter sp.]MDA9092254.1 helix-hairpin-helix domain-containing protein [Polaribacter sp.]MDB4181461.1 helix-hairpin-helix domain-containing protein [Polaribacter sp.]